MSYSNENWPTGPYRDSDIFMDNVLKSIVSKIKEKVADGSMDLLEMYRNTGSFIRFDVYTPDSAGATRQIVSKVIELTRQGVLELKDSSWGRFEADEPQFACTRPGINDMMLNEDAEYSLSFNGQEVKIKAGFSKAGPGDTWKERRLRDVYQQRRFVFVPRRNDDENMRKMIELFSDWIVKQYVDQAKFTLQDMAVKAVAEWGMQMLGQE